MTTVFLALITAFVVTYFLIPPIIRIAYARNLCDEPGERKSHAISTPSLGGIGIYGGVVFSIVLWMPHELFGNIQYILLAVLIIFFVGAKDDIAPISPTKKLVGQLFAALILTLKGNVLIPELFGLFGVNELPYWLSIVVSVFTIIVIINAFNLIDGINALSSSVGILIAATFGTFFMLTGHEELAMIGFALIGSLLAFLRFNITPAKIFMGDTGSLFMGLVCSVLTIKFLQLHHDPSIYSIYPTIAFEAVPAVAIGILILPLFDTLRVFIMRVFRGRSPMAPDRNHIHHLLIDCGFNHMQATGILIAVNALFILLVMVFNDLGTWVLLALIVLIAVVLTAFLKLAAMRKLQSSVYPPLS